MFTDVDASTTSVTVIVGPPMLQDPFQMPDPISRSAAAWNAVLRVLGDLEWPGRLYILLPKHSDEEDDTQDLHPLVITAWRCLLRAVDHLLTACLRPLTPLLAAAGAAGTTARSSLPAWQRACLLPPAVAAGAAVGAATGAGMLLWNLLAGAALVVGAAGSLAGAAAAAAAAVVALAAFGMAAAIAGGVTFAVAHAAKAWAAGAMVRLVDEPLPTSENQAMVAAASEAADRQRQLARVFGLPWARPLPVFRMHQRHATGAGGYRIRNSLAGAGNHAASAGVVWDTWPLLLKPIGMLLGAAAGSTIGVGTGGCGIVWNFAGSIFSLVEAAWHTAQQGIAALLICDPADETAAAAVAAAAKAAAERAVAPAAKVNMPADVQRSEGNDAEMAAKEELDLSEV